MRWLIGVALATMCSSATATSATTAFEVRVTLNSSATPYSALCATGSATTTLNQAVIACTADDGSHQLNGKPYRFLHLANNGNIRNPALWGAWPAPRGVQVFYDATLAPPIRTFNRIDGDGTFEVQVVW